MTNFLKLLVAFILGGIVAWLVDAPMYMVPVYGYLITIAGEVMK